MARTPCCLFRHSSASNALVPPPLFPQDTVLFNDSIMQNIRYGRPDASDEEVMEAAKMAHLHGEMGQGAGYLPVP